MLVIRFKSEALDENWELIKYRINNHDTQSFTRESREPVSVHQAIVSRINPRGGREWAVKQLPHNNDWQGIIYLNRACRPGRRAQTRPVAQIQSAFVGSTISDTEV